MNKSELLNWLQEEHQQMFQHLFTVVKGLPDDIQIDTVHQGKRIYYLVRLGDQRIQPGYFFDHFHDDHEQDVRAWLTRIEEG